MSVAWIGRSPARSRATVSGYVTSPSTIILSAVVNVVLTVGGMSTLFTSRTGCGGSVAVGMLVGTGVAVVVGAGVAVSVGAAVAVAAPIGVSVGWTVAVGVSDGGAGGTTTARVAVGNTGVAVGGWRVGGATFRFRCSYSSVPTTAAASKSSTTNTAMSWPRTVLRPPGGLSTRSTSRFIATALW
jgi:hypothetical protein